MTQKLMTAAVIAALVLTVVAAAREPILRNQTASPAPHPAELPPVPNAGSGDKELAGYRDPHARTRNIATHPASSKAGTNAESSSAVFMLVGLLRGLTALSQPEFQPSA